MFCRQRPSFLRFAGKLAEESDVHYVRDRAPNRENTMPTWMTAREISARLIVGEERLLDYGQRGNLAMYRLDDGSLLFDMDGASRYFRARNAAELRASDQNLGVVGTSRLADRRSSEQPALPSGREERRRDVRRTGTNAPVPHRFAKTG